MDKTSIDEISAAVETLSKRYPHIKLCVIMAQPCAAHHGAHVDLASCGESYLCELIDAAITAYTGPLEKTPLNKELN